MEILIRNWVLIVALTFLIALPRMVAAEVWQAVSEWDDAWEERYSGWLEGEVKPDLLEGAGLKADCADLAYAFRAVFARQNGLPFIATADNGTRYGHFSAQWDKHPVNPDWQRDPRFRRFLSDIFANVASTRTLHHDTYPVAVTPQTVMPGLMVYEDRIASHVAVVGRFDETDWLPVRFYESFIPGYTTFFVHEQTEVQLYPPEIPQRHSGVVRWRRVERINGGWGYRAKDEMPDFSADQYGHGFGYRKKITMLLNRMAFERIHHQPVNDGEYTQHIVMSLLDGVTRRALAMQEGTPGSQLMQVNLELDYLLNRAWRVLRAYDLSRDWLEEQLAQYKISVPGQPSNKSAKALMNEFLRDGAKPLDDGLVINR